MTDPNPINQGGAQNQERQPPEDIPADGGEARKRREPMSDLEKADREMPRAFPDRDPAKKKTGEF